MGKEDVRAELEWLVAEMGSTVKVAKILDITPRWLHYMRAGKGQAGKHLAKEIIRQCRKRR